MDPLLINASFSLIFTSASAGVWFLNNEMEENKRKYASLEARLAEAEKVLLQVKVSEREFRKKQVKQASLPQLEEKMKKAEKNFLVIKAK